MIQEMMNTALYLAMQQAAIQTYPNEACGLLVNTKRAKYELVLCKNVAEDPVNFFVMDAEDQIAAENKGEVVGVWHSHTDRTNKASEADLAGCESSEIPWFIINVTKNYNPEIDSEFIISDVNVITPNGFEMPYEGRPYAFGVFDCWMLCRDYLKREFNIQVGACSHLHIPNWWDGDKDILSENFAEQGFVKLPYGTQPKRGDLFLMKIGAKMPDHCAVYIGDNLILHHQSDRLSCKAVYGGMYQKTTIHHLRHKELL
ncbi:C40 family peptidase [Xenorhabdus szentirmaii]|uniref:Tail assembly protein n=1 Tax=Xenorhabdus szentirmaii DSM 16338 TaxID=1427518 RepID=W1IUV2_9GAMM|nr:C40 family peptidase [Xenorhabdus szentirmaii]PHM30513.1 tail protein [Xenorhabdus szentirmaii DSM 16338]CDL80970.1 putative tail assembly protein [Xenorhabdus szentirmaii DSM 16338]